jgi:transposase
MSLSRLDSQHFWDQMDALPTNVIPLIEQDIVETLLKNEDVSLDTLLCDTTNFFTHIDSANHRCTIAQRGRNKQKRMDLRQYGLLLLVSRQDHLPIFHKVYQGNLVDRTVFKEHFMSILNRFKGICGSLEDITLVFDQGNNSKKMLKDVNEHIHFVGALSPYQHKALIEEASQFMENVQIRGREVLCYEAQKEIWGLDLKVVVYVSEKLRKGQLRGIQQDVGKLFTRLTKLKKQIAIPTKKGKKRTRNDLEKKIASMTGALSTKGIILWELTSLEKDAFDLQFWVDKDQLTYLKEKWLGRRILITNRHSWATEEIVLAYWGQSNVENAFKNMKNPFHLAIRPQYHWTDQKIEVHAFICLLAFLMVMVAYKRARERAGFTGSPHTLLEKLSAIRLATFIESPKKKTKGKYKANYQLEDMDPDILELAEGMGVTDMKLKSNIPFSVYT